MKKQLINKIPTIAIIFGGHSPEYNVSLQSATAVIEAIDANRFQTILIGITKEGHWRLYEGPLSHIKGDTWEESLFCKSVTISFNDATHHLNVNGEYYLNLDGILPIMHGQNGEDGRIQGIFEMIGVPVIGCTALSSAIAMDKHLTHLLAQTIDVQVPKGILVRKDMGLVQIKNNINKLNFPLFIKPLRAGSSFGISMIRAIDELEQSLNTAYAFDEVVIIEEQIVGVELGCAIMDDGEMLRVGLVDEIEINGDIFDFNEKYTMETSQIHLPARISQLDHARVKKTALALFELLQCAHFARFDFFLADSGELYFNEVNTIPGFTANSRFPNMLKGIGLSFPEIVNGMIQGGLRNV